MNVRNAETEILASLVSLGREGAMVNVMSVLKDSSTDYQAAFDIANDMQNRDWIKVIYCSFNAGIINVEITLKGKDELKSRS